MTLTTSVWLTGPITGPEAFELALMAVLDAGECADERPGVEVVRTPANVPIPGCPPHWVIPYDTIQTGHRYGGAWTGVHYREDGGPVYGTNPYEPEDPSHDRAGPIAAAATVEIRWDSPYGYSHPAVGGCADLHARAIALLAQRLSPAVALHWLNEFTGEVYTGVQPDDLIAFTDRGIENSAWFLSEFVPWVNVNVGQVVWEGRPTEASNGETGAR